MRLRPKCNKQDQTENVVEMRGSKAAPRSTLARQTHVSDKEISGFPAAKDRTLTDRSGVVDFRSLPDMVPIDHNELSYY